jgi:hypothetical protein
VTEVGTDTTLLLTEQKEISTSSSLHSSSSFPTTESLSTTRQEEALKTHAKSSIREYSDDNSLRLSSLYIPQGKRINNNHQNLETTTRLEPFCKRKFQESSPETSGVKKVCLPLDLDSLPVFEGVDMDDLLRDIGILTPRNKTNVNGKRSLDDLSLDSSCLQTSNVIANITGSTDDSASFVQSSSTNTAFKQQQMSIDPSIKVFHSSVMSSSSGKLTPLSSSDLPIKRRRDGNQILEDKGTRVSIHNSNGLSSEIISEEDFNVGKSDLSPPVSDTEENVGRMTPDNGNNSDSGMGSTGKIEALFDSSSNSSSNMGDIYSLIQEESTSQEAGKTTFRESPILDDEDVMMSSSCVGQSYHNNRAVDSSVWDSPPSTSDTTFSCFNTDSLENIYSSQVNNNHHSLMNHGINRDNTSCGISCSNNLNMIHSNQTNSRNNNSNGNNNQTRDLIDPDFPFLSDDSLWDSFIDSSLPDIGSNMMMGDQDVFCDNSSSFVSPLMTSSSLNPGMNSISGKNSCSDHPLLPSSMICKPPPTLPLTSNLAMLLQEKTSPPTTPVAVTKKLLTTIPLASTTTHNQATNINTVAVKNAVKGTNSTSHLTAHNLLVQNASRQGTHAVRLSNGLTLTFAPTSGSLGNKQHFVLTTTSTSSTNTTNLIPFAKKIVRVNGIRQTTASGTTAFIKSGSLTVSPASSCLTSNTTSSTAQGKSTASLSSMSSTLSTTSTNQNTMSKDKTASSSCLIPSSDSCLAAPLPVKGNSVLMNLLVNGEDVTNGYSKVKSSFANSSSQRSRNGTSSSSSRFQKSLNLSGSSSYSSSSSSSSSPGSSSPLSFSPLLSSAAMMSDGECNFFDTFSTNTSVDPFSSESIR